jgi:cysteine-rich repeat protein
MGNTFVATVVVKNTGTKDWTPTYSLQALNTLSYAYLADPVSNPPSDKITLLSQQVKPGETATFTFTVANVQYSHGLTDFAWKMSENGAEFGETCTKSITVNGPVNICITDRCSNNNDHCRAQNIQYSVGYPTCYVLSSTKVYDAGCSCAGKIGCRMTEAEGACIPPADARTYRTGNMLYLENSVQKVGMNLDWGGSISEITRAGQNYVNNRDWGRLVQLSVYGDQYGANGWNPVQGTSAASTYELLANSVYTKTRPNHWNRIYRPDLPLQSDMYMEQWVSFVPGNPQAIKVHYKITYFGQEFIGPYFDELPCAYVNSQFTNFIYYPGSSPWTNGPVTTVSNLVGTDVASMLPDTEAWGSFVDASGNGITLYVPNSFQLFSASGFSCCSDTLYMAARANSYSFSSTGAPLEFDAYLITGNYAEARQLVYSLKNSAGSVPFSPSGTMNGPSPNQTASGSVNVWGWAFDPAGIREIDVYLDGSFVAKAQYGIARYDVSNQYPMPNSPNFGFQYTLGLTGLAGGNHTLYVKAVSNDGRWAYLNNPSTVIQIASARCGNGIVEGTEECDDGNLNNNDACTSACKNAQCGDGILRTGVEECDNGANNGEYPKTCSSGCMTNSAPVQSQHTVSAIFFSIFWPPNDGGKTTLWIPTEGWDNYDSRTPGWSEKQIKDMMSAGIDVAFHEIVSYSGDPLFYGANAIYVYNSYHDARRNFFSTYKNLLQQGYKPPKIAEWVNFEQLGWGFNNSYGRQLNLRTIEDENYFYNTLIKAFWDDYFQVMGTYADAGLAKTNGKIMISSDAIGVDIGISDTFFQHIKTRFKNEYGYDVYLLGHPEYTYYSNYPSVDETHNAFGPSTYYWQGGRDNSGKQVIELLPGFASSGQPAIKTPRQQGAGYVGAWQQALLQKSAINHLGITSWNYFGEGSQVTESQNVPNQNFKYSNDPVPPQVLQDRWSSDGDSMFYIKQTAYYSKQWNDIPDNDAQFVSYSIPAVMTAGQTYTASIIMRNAGDNTWSAAKNYQLVLTNADNPFNEPREIAINDGGEEIPRYGGIFRGRPKTFTFSLTPRTPGTYDLKWRMIQQGIEWFGEMTPTIRITVKTGS